MDSFDRSFNRARQKWAAACGFLRLSLNAGNEPSDLGADLPPGYTMVIQKRDWGLVPDYPVRARNLRVKGMEYLTSKFPQWGESDNPIGVEGRP